MANTIKIKRNTSDSDAPTTSNIAQGELAFTEATQILFYRDNSDNIRKIGGEGAFLRSDTDDTMSGNLTVTGNLTIEGTTTTVDSTTVSIADPLFKLAKDSTNDSADLGFYGKYVESGTTKFAGFARDADDSGKFILFDGLQTEPTSTVNKSATGFTKQTLLANIEGNLAGSPQITSPTIVTQLDMNGTELILDADGDTSITADSDDQIDFKVGGGDELVLTSGTLRPAADAGLDLGTSIKRYSTAYFDAVETTNNVAGSTLQSTVSTGTAPLTVASTTKVTNLNADLLDGQSGPSSAIVGLTDTQTLSNKTLTLPQINDTSADHQYVFAVSELTADRTVTLPLLAGNDTFVFADFQQTLDNKTIDGGTF